MVDVHVTSVRAGALDDSGVRWGDWGRLCGEKITRWVGVTGARPCSLSLWYVGKHCLCNWTIICHVLDPGTGPVDKADPPQEHRCSNKG